MPESLYYTYSLAYPDETIFYIGKGSYGRMYDHEREARQGSRSKKCSIIREIWNQGGQVLKRKLYETDCEEDALLYETALITLMNATGMLSNVFDGGWFVENGPRKKRLATSGDFLVFVCAEKFQILRGEAQLSLNKLSRASDVDFRTVHNAENGKPIRDVSASKLVSALSKKIGRKITVKDIEDLKIV